MVVWKENNQENYKNVRILDSHPNWLSCGQSEASNVWNFNFNILFYWLHNSFTFLQNRSNMFRWWWIIRRHKTKRECILRIVYILVDCTLSHNSIYILWWQLHRLIRIVFIKYKKFIKKRIRFDAHFESINS